MLTLTLTLMLSLLFFLHSRYECEEGMAGGRHRDACLAWFLVRKGRINSVNDVDLTG